MNTELQNKAWSVLPKEFKEEVKEEYFACKHCSAEASAMELEIIFGIHNLTSDAEGEEMLTVSRKEVQEMYSAFEEFKDKDNTCFNLETLFGSKCLWDETCNVASKESNPAEEDDVFNDPEPKCLYFKDGKCAHPAVAHLENCKLVKGADCDVSSCEDVEYEPKPAEPKFHKGDKVEVINYDFGLPSLSRCVHEVFTVSDVKYNTNQWMYKLETNKWLFNERDYLESIQWCEHFLKAYKEPKPSEPKFKEGDRALIKARVVNVWRRSGSTPFNTLFNYDIRLDDGRTVNWVDEQWLLPDNDDQVRAVTKKDSERFDKILAKDLRKKKRLRIATQLMAAMMSNPVMFNKSIEYEDIVHGSLEYADALIAAAEKGGCQ